MLKNNPTSNKNKKKSISLKRSYLVLILLLVSTTIIAQNSINKSPFLQLLDQQIEKNYVPQQMNMGIDELTITVPMLYVQLVGSAMRDLKSSLNKYPKSLEKFENLHKEIISIIPQIANVYNSTNSSKIGYEYNDATTLEDYYYRALEGIYSENFKQHYKELKGKDITQVNIPFILGKDEPNYIKEAKKDDAIILLGVEADGDGKKREEYGLLNGKKCPLKSDKNLKIDFNDNPNDDTYLWCDYRQGSLQTQRTYVNSELDGEYLYYFEGRVYERGFYKNNKAVGVWEKYRFFKDIGKKLLVFRTIYDNEGFYQSRESFYRTKSYQSVYLKYQELYVNGLRSEYNHFRENRRKRKHVIFNLSDGSIVKMTCWNEDGTIDNNCKWNGFGYW